jgi:hypothetical protein
MAQSRVQFVDVIPRVFTHAPIASGAGHVAQKIKREIPPDALTFYQFDTGNYEMRFHVSSNTDFLVLRETYLRFNLSCIGTIDGADVDYERSLQDGGVHNMIRRLEISDVAGRVYERIEDYHTLSNILEQVFVPEDHIESCEFVAGNDAGDQMIWTTVGGVIADTAANGVITMTTNVEGLIQRGTVVRIIGTTGGVLAGPFVVGLVSNLTVTLKSNPGLDSFNGLYMQYGRTVSQVVAGETNASLDTKGPLVTMRLNSGFLSQVEDWPLFGSEGLVIRLELNAPERLMKNSAYANIANANATMNYRVQTPRLLVTLRTPSEDVRAQYFDLMQKGELTFAFPVYHCVKRSETGAANTKLEMDLPIAKSSIRRVFCVIQDSVSTGIGADAEYRLSSRHNDSNKFKHAGIRDYQFKVGGRDYPPLRVNCEDILMADAHTELQRTFNLHGNISAQPRLPWSKWVKRNVSNASPVDFTESHKAIFATTFSTLEDDPMSGLKTKGYGTDSHVIASFDFADEHKVMGNTSNRNFTFFFEHLQLVNKTPSTDVILN